MLKLKPDESVRRYFRELNILTVYGLYVLEAVMFVKYNCPNNPQNNNGHNYNTRQKNKFDFQRHRLELYKKKTTYTGKQLILKIPETITKEKDCLKFKRRLKEYLTSLVLYSIEELDQSHVG
jgi:hypothetical protein